ncbi:MAG: flagellar hook capping FlgD N-terminal domain-containing protein [Sulfitobacter sp.]|nr:flagellar hook capping FlgD N-terminal domain-containing protein [Sulfitobacter sp.]
MGLAPVSNTSAGPSPFPTAVQEPAIATAATLPSSEASTVLSSDFETFLKMLTAQAQYQDPLQPIDSSEYAAQLAQFSMVEQQVLANDRLAEMTAQLQVANMSQIASLIGMEARTREPVFFDGNSIRVATPIPPEAEEAYLLVKNDQGLEVSRRTLSVEGEEITWNGRNTAGTELPEGLYSFEVESYAQGRVIATEPTAAYLEILEARSLDGQAGLILKGGTQLLASSLDGLRSDG